MLQVVVFVKPVGGELSPFDESALECALRLENARVTVVSMCRPDVEKTLTELTRLGVSEAILLTDPMFAGSDTLATAYVLSLAAKRLMPNLILCGRQSMDGDTAQVGPCLAALLGLPVITGVMALQRVTSVIRCVSRTGEESAVLPAVITVERIHTLRFPGIRSKTVKVTVWSASDIAADPARCGTKGSPTRVLQTFESISGRRKCLFIEPEQLEDAVKQALKKPPCGLKAVPSPIKLESVWSVGREPLAMARSISEKVRVIECQEPAAVARLAEREKPLAILWDSGLWGRRIAPQAAAMLRTGLCADCTALKTDGEKLFMFRPAFGGSIMAKVVCRTFPQMATVRTCQNCGAGVIISAGAGAARDLARLREYAGKHGYALAASRSLVDKGLMPYEQQVGLTGRNISPQVYIACGISGAIQHTCAIEQAGTVIAVNTDRNARIFEYADYGILAPVSDVF